MIIRRKVPRRDRSTSRTEIVRVRLERELVQQLDAWIARQPEDADRSEAIRAMVAAVLEVVDNPDEGGEAR
jgi:metal-responsive CopG/Arc/MetJ family transcriptional regulator